MAPQAPSGTLTNPRYPTFYACYLLQSLRIPGSTYIGSTPNPVRRLRQHNREIKGGASKTRDGRPWDMTMIVHGFPTKTAALQFEWAWQHPTKSLNLKGVNGHALVGSSRALATKIRTVRLMVKTHPYSTWPLHVKLFSPDAVAAWNKATKVYPTLPPGFTSAVELEGVDGKKASIHVGSGRTGPIDVRDAVFTTQHLAAASVLRASRNAVTCTVCEETLDFAKADPLTVALCPTTSCLAASHITCLAVSFLSQERSDAIIPRGGSCSRCDEWVLWGDVIRGADRRKFETRTAEEDEEMTDGEKDHMELDSPDQLFPALKKSKPMSRAKQKSIKKVAVTAKRLAPASKRARKNTAPEILAEKPRRGSVPKASHGAPYSTSAVNAAWTEEKFEDFSPLIDLVPDVTDEDSSDDVAGALSGVTLASPKRPRYIYLMVVVPAAGWQPEPLLILLSATTMRLWPVLGILSIAFARNPQTFEITATKFADGSCELHQWRPTQLHKDVTETSPAYLERQYQPVNSEGIRGELIKIYGHEEQAMLRLLEEECINLRSSESRISPGPSPQLILGNEIPLFKPLPTPPPLKLTPLLSSGPSDNRIDLVFFADGYTAEEESKFLADAERLALDISANQTFATVKPLLNIWAAFTPSNETGIGTEKERKDTAFGLYRVGTELRAIYCGRKPVARAACASLGTGCDYPILLANSPYYGGLGGEFSISTSSTLNGALVLRHELGHSIIKVGEEYDGGYAYFGPNSAHSIKKPHIKWERWLSDPSRFSKEGIIPERAVSPLQAYPWTLLNHSDPYTALFNSSGTYSFHMIRFSLSGLPKHTDLLVLLDGVDVRWEPRPNVGIDRWHYDIIRHAALSAGTHNLTFSLGVSATEGLAQLCSFEIIAYGSATQFNTTLGNIGAYPTFSMWNATTYRPTNEGCLMRQVMLPQFCKPCSEGLWLQLLKRVDLIDQVEVIRDASRENVTIRLTSVGLGQFRADTAPHRESLEFSWALNGTLLSQFTNKTTIILPYAEAAGSWEAFATFRTEEVQMDPKGYLNNSKVFSI